MTWSFPEWGWRWVPGGVAAVAITGLLHAGALSPLEWAAYQGIFWLQGARPADPRVVIVAIDEPSIRQLGQFPWSRRHYIPLLEQLTRAEASVVAFDVLWSEPSSDDARLAQAIAQHGSVVLAQAWDSQGLPLLPVPVLDSSATARGHILKQEDPDGIPRKVELQIQGEPALAVAIAQTYRLQHTVAPLPALSQPLWINWTIGNIPRYSFVDVMQGRIPVQMLRDKLVLVGSTAAGFDPLITPFHRNPPTGGVYLHAVLVSNLLQQTWLQPPSLFWFTLALLLAGPALSRVLSLWRMRTQVMVWLGLSGGWAALSLGLLHYNYWLWVASPLILFTSTTLGVVVCDRLRINVLLQQQAQTLWQAHHHNLVITPDSPDAISYTHLPVSMQQVHQLALLAEQFGRSQSAQAAIARSLSIGLLAADLDGRIWFCNPVAANWLQVQVGDCLQPSLIPRWLSQLQWQTSLNLLQRQQPVPVQEIPLQNHWFELRLEPLVYPSADPLPSGLLLLLEEITDRKQAAIAQADLNQQLSDRTLQLEVVNEELEAFNYAVSHDLRSPLWRVDGFSQALLEDNLTQLDDAGQDYLHRIRASVERMQDLVEDLLKLSRITSSELCLEPINLSKLVDEIAQDLQQTQPARTVEFAIRPDRVAVGDWRLLKIALENLLGNAWKFTSQRSLSKIEFGELEPDAEDMPLLLKQTTQTAHPAQTFFIRDNGAGFDMTDAEKLFNAFQRLPNAQAFAGTGIGLMTVRRIIQRHGGQVLALGELDRGATFFFTLPHTSYQQHSGEPWVESSNSSEPGRQ